jgi:hypothetical protein
MGTSTWLVVLSGFSAESEVSLCTAEFGFIETGI